MNQNHIATMGAVGTAGAAVGIFIWLLHLAIGIEVPADVEAYMVTLAAAAGGYFFHKPDVPSENPTSGQG